MKDRGVFSVGVIVGVIALLAFFGLVFTGNLVLAFAALVLALAMGISEYRQRQRPPEPGE